jgi:RNA polymerase sigma-70 factor, ECF subfamily
MEAAPSLARAPVAPVLECRIPTAMSTDAVISGFLRGEHDCHAQVDRWIHEVLGHRRFSLGSDLDDVAQEVRRKLLLSFRAERFRGDSSLRTYVWKAAQRAVIDHARSRRRRSVVPLESLPPVPALETADGNVTERDRRDVFRRVMETLDEGCRHLWALIAFEELPYAEIARRLGTTEGNVKVRALRCRAKATEIARALVTSPGAGRP